MHWLVNGQITIDVFESVRFNDGHDENSSPSNLITSSK